MTQSVSLIIVTDHRLFGECLASVLVRCGSFTVQAVVQTAEEALQPNTGTPIEYHPD